MSPFDRQLLAQSDDAGGVVGGTLDPTQLGKFVRTADIGIEIE